MVVQTLNFKVYPLSHTVNSEASVWTLLIELGHSSSLEAMIPPRPARLVRELGLGHQRLRFSSREAPKKVPVKLYKSSELKEDQSYVSTADPKSMIRFYRGKVPEDETEQERAYRLRYEEVQLWNMRFWAKNNEAFQEVNMTEYDLRVNYSDC